MTSAGNWPPPDEVPPYCRICRTALHRRRLPSGMVTFIHAADLRGGHSDHEAQPVPLSQLTDPVMECDFCSGPHVAWIYVCADQETDTRIVTASTVDLHDYQRRHHAARTRSVETHDGPLQRWGTRWSACDGCAALIEDRDLYGLIARVTDAMPTKYTRGRKLIEVRGHLYANYSTVFATLRPGRGRIIPSHPLGVWDPPDENPPGSNETGARHGSPTVEQPP